MGVKKPVSFKDSELYLLEYALKKFSFSVYVKELIAKDMEQQENKAIKVVRKESASFNNFDF